MIGLLLFTCDSPTAPPPVGSAGGIPGSTRILPPPPYRVWWDEAEECSHRTGNFEAVVWYSVDTGVRNSFPCSALPESGCAGLYVPDSHSLYLASVYLNTAGGVKHEMLHALGFHPGHPQPPFNQCAPLVFPYPDPL